jgi:cell division protein FtsB
MTRSSVKWFAWLALFLGLCGAAAVDSRGWRTYLKLREEARGLEDKNRVAARENQRLSREARALKENPAAIERAVREELGFIHPGELVLQLRSEEPEHK